MDRHDIRQLLCLCLPHVLTTLYLDISIGSGHKRPPQSTQSNRKQPRVVNGMNNNVCTYVSDSACMYICSAQLSQLLIDLACLVHLFVLVFTSD